MDRAVKITLAVSILTVGTFLAFLYRHPSSDGDNPSLDNEGRLVVLRGPRWDLPSQTQAASRPYPRQNSDPINTTSNSSLPRKSTDEISPAPKSTVLLPIDTGQPPPRLARVFPSQEKSADSPWGYALGSSADNPDQVSLHLPTTHKLVDGDTLESLGLRYYGDSSRGQEIYEANRQVLLNPSVLPIGVELVIPSGDKANRTVEGIQPDKPIVPVTPSTN